MNAPSGGFFKPAHVAGVGKIANIDEVIGQHEILLGYHLQAFDRAIEFKKQDEQLQLAANHAAIITALKGMRN